MRTLNKVMIIGRLGQDPRVKYLENGVLKATFPVATDESFRNKAGEKVEITEWHNIVVWRNLASIAEKFLKKGSLVFIEGRLKSRSWKDENGHDRHITEIEALDLSMLERRPFEDRSNSRREEIDDLPQAPESDDLPF